MSNTSNNFEITGFLVKIFPTEVKTEKFKVREFVIEIPAQYPQMVKFQTKNERCDILEQYAEGEEIEVSFNLSGREWQGKYFTTLEAWKIKRTGTKVVMSVSDEEPIGDTYDELVSKEKAAIAVLAQLDTKKSIIDPFSSVSEDDLPF